MSETWELAGNGTLPIGRVPDSWRKAFVRDGELVHYLYCGRCRKIIYAEKVSAGVKCCPNHPDNVLFWEIVSIGDHNLRRIPQGSQRGIAV